MVDPDWTVKVSAPKRVSDSYISAFIESKKAWIAKAHAYYQQGKNLLAVKENEILLHGVPYGFEMDSGSSPEWQGSRPVWHDSKTKIIIDHENHTITSNIDLTISANLESRYRTYAKEYLSKNLEIMAKKHGLEYAKCIIRGQKTKWWTCSTKKNIWLNWKLVKMPHEIAEYVICHELAHLKELNHSKRFWAVVESLYPNYKEAEAWMKKYGLSLQ